MFGQSLDQAPGIAQVHHMRNPRLRGQLPPRNVAHVRRAAGHNGAMDVRLQDCREVTRETFGEFDAAVSLGAFEHFCSIEEWQEGRQDAIYGRLFENVAGVLPQGGRFFLQTMVFGKNMIAFEDFDPRGAKDSDGRIMADLQGQFPGSWLPDGPEQVERCAAPHMRLVRKSSGRLDYIETIGQWGRRYRRFSARKYLYYASLIPQFAFDRSFRDHIRVLVSDANRMAFRRELLDHYRFVFEKA